MQFKERGVNLSDALSLYLPINFDFLFCSLNGLYLLWHFGLKNVLSLKIVCVGHSSFPEAGPVKYMQFSI